MRSTAAVYAALKVSERERERRRASSPLTPGSLTSAASILAGSNNGVCDPVVASTFSQSTPPRPFWLRA